MAARTEYLPLFAKAQIVLGLWTIVIMAVLYPMRRSEVTAYERTPACFPESADQKICRRMVKAEVLHVDCSTDSRKAESCRIELRAENRTMFFRLVRELSERLPPGSQLRIEMLGDDPMAAEVDGRLVREYGSPETALKTLRLAAGIQAILTVLAAVYLLRRRRRASTG